MGFQMSVMCIGQLAMQAVVNSLGTAAVAGYTAASKADQLSVLVNNAMMTAISNYVAQNFGAGKKEKVFPFTGIMIWRSAFPEKEKPSIRFIKKAII